MIEQLPPPGPPPGPLTDLANAAYDMVVRLAAASRATCRRYREIRRRASRTIDEARIALAGEGARRLARRQRQ